MRGQDYFERGIELAIQHDGISVTPVDISDLFAVEVDFEGDLERANARYVTTVREVSNVWAQGRDGRDFRPGERLDAFRNRRFATVVPADALRRSRPVRQEMGRVRAEDWRRAARLEEGPPRPGPDTAGLTPAAAYARCCTSWTGKPSTSLATNSSSRKSPNGKASRPAKR